MRSYKTMDLSERTILLAESVIKLAKLIPLNTITKPLVSQLVRSATSIDANYCEACNAESRKDFIHKIGVCRKEASETKYWLHLLARAYPQSTESCRILWKESHELTSIFSTITKNKTPNINSEN